MEKVRKMDNGLNNTAEGNPSKNGRIHAIDALRGFAIAAILLIHSSNNFLYSTAPAWSQPKWLNELDEAVKHLLYFLFEGKAYAIFALLFGFTYALQYANQQVKGRDFRWRMAWRMFILIGFGMLNAAFFPGGDPLVFYALTMFAVIPMIKLRIPILALISALLLLQPLEIINAIHPFMPVNHAGYYEKMAVLNPESNFFEIMRNNLVWGLQGCLLWALETGRLIQTMGLFIVGIIAYRTKFFTQEKRFYARILLFALLLAVLCFFLKIRFPLTPIIMYYNLFGSVVLVCIILLAYNRSRQGFSDESNSSMIWKNLEIYGKMSLTNFIGQSIICSFLFHSWGLNLTAYCGPALSVGIGFLVLFLQIWLSRLWLKHHSKGPFETLWHRLTWRF